ncbi:MAG: helix-hairpin-helix domain-containing protein [Variovorax sp.]|nr:helix-hairpin-helix domain-containing protein [Variovorax sp.]
MFKKIVAASAMLFAVASWAAVDANKASEGELDGLKGVGPALSKRIIEARNQGEFKDWADFMTRVKGVKDKSATKLSDEGLTVNGKPFTESAPAANVKKDAAKKDESQASAAKAANKQ